MDYDKFLNRLIDEGLVAAQDEYKHQPEHLNGAVAGFEACRGRRPHDLASLLAMAREETAQAYWRQDAGYWRSRCYEAEVEYVCNCVSAMQVIQGHPAILAPTTIGFVRASEVLGFS